MFRLIEYLFELIGSIMIVMSPLTVFGVIGISIRLNHTDQLWSLIAMLALILLGLVLGIIWTNYIWKKYGTINYLSRMASGEQEIAEQDLDRESNEENKHG